MPKPIQALGIACLLPLGVADADAAVTQRVRDACRADYYAYCSAHAVGSASLQACMRAVQDRLTLPCLRELVAAGEVSKREIRRYEARRRR